MYFHYCLYLFTSFFFFCASRLDVIYESKEEAVMQCTKDNDALPGYYWCTGYYISPIKNRMQNGFDYCVDEIISLNGDVTYKCAKEMPVFDGPVEHFDLFDFVDTDASSSS
ncbi:uncharacterized protein LOC122498467 [Leptopilina heterotoma]|uniref:uncharacterized protein LOC122498467 n=1 Tax=Leptopilina heterotoma TaxID=63436 RepID=UPI001CA91179|nr:uncharacterized protein LOC122498467 [Leptopilina heterotoma]